MANKSEPLAEGRIVLHPGDCRKVMDRMAENTFDAVVCDPPYHLQSITKRFAKTGRTDKTRTTSGPHQRTARGFMNQTWDGGSVAFEPETWSRVLRVLKPGAFCLAMGGDRTVHRLACAMEDAGFEIRGQLVWIFGSGFPKSLNISRDLLSLPWCSCGGGQIAGARTISSVMAKERLAASSARSGVAPSTSRSSKRSNIGINTGSPPSDSGATDGAIRPFFPSDDLVADGAKRLRNKLGGSPRHGRAAKKRRIEDGLRNLDPVVLGSPDVTVAAQGNQVRLDIGIFQSKPETLRDNVVDVQIDGCPAVPAGSISGNDGCGNVLPSAPFVGPSAAAPSGVPVATESISVRDRHTGAGTVDRTGAPLRDIAPECITANGTTEDGCPTLEHGASGASKQDGLSGVRTSSRAKLCAGEMAEELDAAMFAKFGRHSKIINELILEGKISKCHECGYPRRPAWINDGLGTALKPAMELIVLARKPLSEKTVAANVLKWGCGAINISGCRVPVTDADANDVGRSFTRNARAQDDGYGLNRTKSEEVASVVKAEGRWPANVILSHDQEVIGAFPDAPGQQRGVGPANGAKTSVNTYGDYGPRDQFDPRGDSGSAARFFCTIHTTEEDRQWQNGSECKNAPAKSAGKCLSPQSAAAVSALSDAVAQSTPRLVLHKPSYRGHDTNVSGHELELICASVIEAIQNFERRSACGLLPEKLSAKLGHVTCAIIPNQIGTITITISLSTSNQCAEVATFDIIETREEAGEPGSAKRLFYCAKADSYDRAGAFHPTVKPIDLIQYLVKLVTPPKGLILDCFAGTGTTAEAAIREGCRVELIEKDTAYCEDIRRRARLMFSGPEERARESIKAKIAGKPIDLGPLFGGAGNGAGNR